MKPRAKARILAALVVAVLCCLALYKIGGSFSAMGKEAFLTWQAARFDKYYARSLYSHYLVEGMFFWGAILGVYEMVAFGLYLVIKPKRDSGAA